MKFMRYLLAIALAMILVACGGGGGSSGNSPSAPASAPSSGTPVVDPAIAANANISSISIASSASELNADGKSSVTFTIFALTSGNASIPGAIIDFAATNGVILSTSSVVTTAEGATVTMTAVKTDQTKRVSTFTASCSKCLAAPSTVQININAASINLISSINSIVVGESGAVLTSTVKDFFGKAIPNVNVSFAATDPAVVGLSAPMVVTDSSGVAQVTVSGLKQGSSSVNVTALGNASSQSYKVGVPSPQLTVKSPASKTIIYTNATPPLITVAAPGAATVTFVTSLGKLKDKVTSVGSQSQNVPVINGTAKVYFQPEQAGNAMMNITDDLKRSASLILVVSPPVCSANKINLTASRTSLPVSSATVQSSITLVAQALAYDRVTGVDQPVAGVPIVFSMTGGPGSGEILTPALVSTEPTGNAAATFTAGTSASITNGVVISASILPPVILDPLCPPFTSTYTGLSPSNSPVAITIGGNAMSVAFGPASVITDSTDKTLYIQTYGVQVTDANNNPVSNQVVTLHMRPVAFSVGAACVPFKNPPVPYSTYCSEDFNGNGSLDSGEDGARVLISNNGAIDNLSGLCLNKPVPPVGILGTVDKNLTPQNSDGGSVPATVMTDQKGVASFDHTYLKSSAGWLVNMLTATVVSNGTESSKSTIFRLVASEADPGPPCHLPASPYQY